METSYSSPHVSLLKCIFFFCANYFLFISELIIGALVSLCVFFLSSGRMQPLTGCQFFLGMTLNLSISLLHPFGDNFLTFICEASTQLHSFSVARSFRRWILMTCSSSFLCYFTKQLPGFHSTKPKWKEHESNFLRRASASFPRKEKHRVQT